MNIPPYIDGVDKNSFAAFTIRQRLPKIINDVITDNVLDDTTIKALNDLKVESQSGPITVIRSLANDEKPLWHHFFAQWEGATYFEAPFFMVEAYFYRRMMEIIQFSSTGLDPFSKKKKSNLTENQSVLDSMLPSAIQARHQTNSLKALIQNSLWGNTADLSQFGNYKHDGFNQILIDRTAQLCPFIESKVHDTFDIILDNAGLELISDLALTEFLLRENKVRTIRLHFKYLPIFVSDAIPRDLNVHLDYLATVSDQCSEFASNLLNFIGTGRLVIGAHVFWNSPLHFTELSSDLTHLLRTSSLMIVKGDANYRRLFEDRMWKYTEPVGAHLVYLPCAVTYFRILKSEIVLGLSAEKVSSLKSKDQNWPTNGTCGIIDFHALKESKQF